MTLRRLSDDERYAEYVKNCKKKPRTFGNWLVVTNMVAFHREIIRPRIIWWQTLRKELNLPNYKWR